MKHTVLVFGPLARAMGQSRIDVSPDAKTCGDIRSALQRDHPAAAELIRSGRFAVNHQFVSDAHAIGAGDEVALIVAVSGG